MVEEHGKGQQLYRFRAWPKAPPAALAILFALITLAGFAIVHHAAVAGAVLLLMGGALGFLIYADCALAMSQWRNAIDAYVHQDSNLCVVAPIASAADNSQSGI
jgi:hypothetical protein